MRPFRNSASRQGFSFTEVMIAVLIIGATLSPIVFVFSRGTSGTIRTRDEVLAYNYATELLDFAQTRKFGDSPLLDPGEGKTADEIEISGGGAVRKIKIDPKFQRFLSVRIPTSPPGLPFDYKVLVVEVRWKNSGIEKKIQMSSIKYRPR